MSPTVEGARTVAGTLPSPLLTGPSPTDEPRRPSLVRLPLRDVVIELLLGSVLAAAVSLFLQFAATRLGISEPSFAPEALASLAGALILVVLFALLAFGHRRSPHWMRLVGTWLALAGFSTLTLSIPLQNTRYYFGGSSIDNGFRMQYMTRMASSPALADMNYAETAPYYPAGWFWLGGRFANLLGWEGWAAYKPWALISVTVTSVVAFTLWSVVLRRRLALLATLATTLAGMLHGVEEPYAWASAAWLPPIAVLTWHALRRESRAPRWTLVCIGAFAGFAAVTYTLHFAFIVLMIVIIAITVGGFRLHQGAPAWPTFRQLFLRVLPIALVSALIALLVWTPYLFSTSFLLDNPRSAAQHYLPEEGAFLPVPMTETDVFGLLCLAGLVWLLLRCSRSEIAAALLTVVITVYAWFGLSILALIAKTTLLAFRLNVILGVVLATAGVLGVLELIGYLRRKLDARYTLRISVVATSLGLIGAVTLTQGAIGTSLESQTEQAYVDYYPTGDNAKGEKDPRKDQAWTDEVISTVSALTGRESDRNILLTTDYKLMSFQPYWGFQQETPHYANPLARYDDRAEEIKSWTRSQDSAALLRNLDESEFASPNVFVLRTPESQAASDITPPKGKEGALSLNLKGDAFPQLPNVSDYQVFFDPALFDSPEFSRRDVGPYAIIVRN